MRGKKILSYIMAIGMSAAMFAGMVPAAHAAAVEETPTAEPFEMVGIQRTSDGNVEWFSDKQYIKDGKRLSGLADDMRDSVSMYYDKSYGRITFNESMKLYGISDQNYQARSYSTAFSIYDKINGTEKYLSNGLVRDFKIRLNNDATLTIDATNRKSTGSAYGVYVPKHLVIEGKGTVKIHANSGGGNDRSAICLYGANAQLTVKDDVHLIVEHDEGHGIYAYNGTKNINIEDNALVEMKGGTAAINKVPNITGRQKIYAGEDRDSASELNNTASISTYKYVRISQSSSIPTETPATPTLEPTKNPTPAPTAAPTETPMPEELRSAWIGIQTSPSGKADWYYDRHYLMPDGKHYNENSNQAEGFIKGAEVMYYDKTCGRIDFNKNITLYGINDSGYYGAGIAIEASKNLRIRLNNNATVTIDATNGGRTATYLYGLYATGHLTIEGNGTLIINAAGGHASDLSALCVYGNKGGLTVKDNVHLILNHSSGWGLKAYRGDNTTPPVYIEDNALVEMTGGIAAIEKKPYAMSANHHILVGTTPDDAALYDAKTELSLYKYARITTEEIKASFEPRAEYRYDGNNEGSFNFAAKVSNLADSASECGFWFVNIGDDNELPEVTNETAGSKAEALTNGGTFYYTFNKVPVAGAEKMGVYAIPWIKAGNNVVQGDAFTYGGTNFTSQQGEVLENTAVYNK